MFFSNDPLGKRTKLVTTALSLVTRKRYAIRLGFAVVLGSLIFSTVEALQVQKSLSAEALEIYHRHVKQDESLYQLRRTIWMGSNSARDLLLNPFPDRETVYRKQLRELREESQRSMKELAEVSAGLPANSEVQSRVLEFWDLLERVPDHTRTLNPEERYLWVQSEIVARRNSVGQLVRRFTEVANRALRDSESEFTTTRRLAARRLVIILGVSLLFGLIVTGISLAHSENLERAMQRHYDEVAQAKIDLQRLAARLMEVQETERTRISREMHDEIGQALATLRIEIAHAETLSKDRLPDVVSRLRRARELAERTVETVRNMCAELRPSLLDDLGLEAALDWQMEDFSWRTGVRCSLRRSGETEDLPDAIKTCVFRVVQESMHNCEKHAHASNMLLRLSRNPESLEVAIEDDGNGFAMKSHKERVGAGQFGILGMQERATSLGGHLEVSSGQGAGSRILLTLPVPSPLSLPKPETGKRVEA